jgi:hypothetical protein
MSKRHRRSGTFVVRSNGVRYIPAIPFGHLLLLVDRSGGAAEMSVMADRGIRTIVVPTGQLPSLSVTSFG